MHIGVLFKPIVIFENVLFIIKTFICSTVYLYIYMYVYIYTYICIEDCIEDCLEDVPPLIQEVSSLLTGGESQDLKPCVGVSL